MFYPYASLAKEADPEKRIPRVMCYGVGQTSEPKIFRKRGWHVDTCDFGLEHTVQPKWFPKWPRTYHVITAIEVIEHLREPYTELGSIIDHLAPGGVFVGSTGFWSRLKRSERNSGWWYTQFNEEGHVTFWTLQGLDHVAQAHGAYVVVMGNTPKLCAGMPGSGQAPFIVRKYGENDL
jgi:hypothetical protein